MTAPISVRLDDDVPIAMEAEAEAARKARRDRIRKQSEVVGRYVAETPEAAAFYDEWGTPSSPVP